MYFIGEKFYSFLMDPNIGGYYKMLLLRISFVVNFSFVENFIYSFFYYDSFLHTGSIDFDFIGLDGMYLELGLCLSFFLLDIALFNLKLKTY